MNSILPERRQELRANLSAYLEKHYITQRLDWLPLSSGAAGAAPVRTDRRCTDAPDIPGSLEDNWDILERIFTRKGPGQPDREAVQELIEEAEKEETFVQALLRLIQERQLTGPEVYNRVFMDRKLFNKIRNTPEYQPSKRTALLLCLALELDLEETQELIGKAGFKLSHSNKSDVIIEYFIVNGNYNVMEINEMLDEFHMPLLLRCD